jgi:hypothetical protein
MLMGARGGGSADKFGLSQRSEYCSGVGVVDDRGKDNRVGKEQKLGLVRRRKGQCDIGSVGV